MGGHHVLDRQRDAQQRAIIACGDGMIGGFGVRERAFRRQGDKGVDGRLKLLDALQIGLRQFDGGDFARAQFGERFGDRQMGEVGHRFVYP